MWSEIVGMWCTTAAVVVQPGIRAKQEWGTGGAEKQTNQKWLTFI